MNRIGRKIYYDTITGNPLVTTGEMQGYVRATTLEEDIQTYVELRERFVDSFAVLELPYGAYTEEFATCTGYRVNPERSVIDFIFDGREVNELEDLKAVKITNLNRTCEATIEAGFTSEVNGHVYRTNRDDQLNFIGQRAELIDDPMITTVPWKTEDVGYVNHTREEWLAIHAEGLAHKKAQLFKYDQLKQQVLQATTTSEVDAILW